MKAIVVEGPKGAGKALVAHTLAKTLGSDIVLAESLQLFAKYDIGVGKPNTHMQRAVKYHMLSHYQPNSFSITNPITAWRYRVDAMKALTDIWAQGKIPVIEGGSALYTKCLIYGKPDVALPEIPQEIRLKVRSLIEPYRHNWEACVELIQREVPKADLSMNKGDFYRLEKAAISALAGAPLQRDLFSSTPQFDARVFYIDMDDASLTRAIPRNCLKMLDSGLVEEVINLIISGDFNVKEANQKQPEHAMGYSETFTYIKQLLEGMRKESLNDQDLTAIYHTYLTTFIANSRQNLHFQRKAFRQNFKNMVNIKLALDSFSQFPMATLIPRIINLANSPRAAYESECGDFISSFSSSLEPYMTSSFYSRPNSASELNTVYAHLKMLKTHKEKLSALGL